MYHKIAKICQIIFILLLFIYSMLLIWCPDVLAETIKGKARVIDGDTIEIQGEKNSLFTQITYEADGIQTVFCGKNCWVIFDSPPSVLTKITIKEKKEQ